MRIGTTEMETPWATVVGDVANSRIAAPDPRQAVLRSRSTGGGVLREVVAHRLNGNGGFIMLRSSLPPELMTNSLRTAVRSLDPHLPCTNTNDGARHQRSEAPRRFNTVLISSFAAGALLLAILGIYAVIAFTVAMRAQEMAIRMALGSRRGQIVRLVLTSGAKLAAIGCGAGLIGALAVSKLLGSMLFNVSATDPLILAGSIATMILLSLIACAVPAQRAASANPVDALRSE